MNVNFNNLRAQACFAYDRLCSKLNKAIIDGEIAIQPEEIQKEMDALRMTIGCIASCSLEDNDDFKDVYEEKYPEGTTLACFNEEEK